jgi:hypothetical protein
MQDVLPDEPMSPWDLPETVVVFQFPWESPVTIGSFEQEVVLMCETMSIADALKTEVEAQFAHGEPLSCVEVQRVSLVERYAGGLFWDESGEVHPTSFSRLPDLESHREFPAEPYALFTSGGGIDRSRDEHLEGEYVVHQADDNSIWVLFFEDLDAAEKVLMEYIDATDRQAEIRRTRAVSLDSGQNVRFYAADGTWQDLLRDDYLSRIIPT